MAATATKSKPETRVEKARFMADGIGLRVVFEPRKERFSEAGVKQPVPGSGKTVSFVPNGMGGQFYETSDPDEIAILRAKAASDDPKFTEVPIPVPSSANILKDIVGLAVRGDKDALVALAVEEEATHGREDVLEAIADALEQIGA